MSRARKLVVVVLALVLLSAVSVSVGSAQGPMVIPPDNPVPHLSYSQWAARFFQWVFAIPFSENPGFGQVDSCITHQSGQMVMVAANTFTGHPQDCGVISNRAMLFMMAPVGTECSMVEPYPFYGGNEAELNACADAFTWSDLSASLDGQPIAVTDEYIVRSPMYRLRWGPDNGFGLPPGVTWSVAKAPFLMFAPLSPGKHTIEVHGVMHGPDGLEFGGDGEFIFNVK